MTAELVTLLGDHEVGRVRRDWRGRISFVYADDWRARPDAYPLSISMPLSVAEHGHRAVRGFLDNLLPDNAEILHRWGKKFHVEPDDLLGLLGKVGEDCAGAVRFVAPDRTLQDYDQASGSVEWLEPSAVAERLRALWADISAWRRAVDPGQFTLAGAQAKTALFFVGAQWGIPSGGIPTTHLLKPGARYEAHPQNEHFCLSLARALGLSTANSFVEWFEDEVAIVVERYDREQSQGGISRVHQEDLCQGLGIPPSEKYESDGGPNARKIADFIRAHSVNPEEDVGSFVAALVYNWIIGGADAHAKNYSLLIRPGGRVSHAPLYDIASALPYTEPAKIQLSMSIGGSDRLLEIGAMHYKRLFRDLGLEEEAVKAAMTAMADCVPDLATDLHAQCKAEGLTHDVIDRLSSAICERARRCAAELRAWPPASRV